MPVYEYTALDSTGKQFKGIIDAASAIAARQKLRDTNFFPVELKESAAGNKTENLAGKSVVSILRRIGPNETSVMTRQLSTLLNAGLPLIPSLSVLVNQTQNPELKQTLAQIRSEVNEGKSLSQSLTAFPKVFPSYFVNMVRAGEASGKMDIVLERLADFSEKQQALKLRIISALTYPVFMVAIGTIVIFFLLAFVVPNITKVFDEMHQDLPVATIVLIFMSKFLQSFWWLLAAALAGGGGALHYFFTKTDKGRYVWDTLKLKLPLFGTVNQKLAVARFSRTLGTLLQSGVPLLTALDIVKNIVNNRIIADAIQTAGEEVREGQSLSAPLARSRLFPPIATEMIAIGEQSGNLEPMLYRIADSYEKEVESSVAMMTSVLEPVMILTLGVVVGFIVISVLLPIFEMNQLVK
jgi:general secretion pathway protein F